MITNPAFSWHPANIYHSSDSVANVAQATNGEVNPYMLGAILAFSLLSAFVVFKMNK